MRGGRPLKRWRYVGIYRPDVMLCVGDAIVAGLRRRWCAVALPDGTLRENTGSRRAGVRLAPGGVRVRSEALALELSLDEGPGVEVASPHGRQWIWTRKQACVAVRGRLWLEGREWALAGHDAFVDDSAGYHARHTRWRWSAGLGRAATGERVAWNLVEGVHDAPEASERTVWVDGEPHEVGPQPFAADLSRVGGLRFTPWSVREDDTNLLLVRSRYRQPFGTFAGELPGGLALESGQGVMEWHDAIW
ncbi:MAG: DUF2804 family protein [Thermoleophilaceae bacterium]|nr:DUF2804 family protein [Thermoleophilaceae bacterium]